MGQQQDIILSVDDNTMIDQHLLVYLETTEAIGVILMRRDGTLLAKKQTVSLQQDDSLCALSAAAFLSSESLAALAGEPFFNSIAHQGTQNSTFISQVGDDHLLLVLFDSHASAAVIRLQAKVTAEAIIDVIERAYAREQKSRQPAVVEEDVCDALDS